MELEEAKAKFVQAWGRLGSGWGINRTMAQVHVLLLVSPEALTADEIMKELKISRGNANMNLRMLIDWGLIQRLHKPGERKEYFEAEKDMWTVFRQIVKERRRRELQPIFKVLEELKQVKGDRKDPSVKAFVDTLEGIHGFASKTDSAMQIFIMADENWFLKSFMKLMQSNFRCALSWKERSRNL